MNVYIDKINLNKKLNKRKEKIRNFSIIAHIDHGKSTLADRILEITNTIEKRSMKSQFLDSMELERERGITIKLNSVEIIYKSKDQNEYIMHLIDTPGHVDFSYEVSRSLAACEGVLLIVDCTQGIQAQTVSNIYLALENNLTIIPVLNKIDLPNANIEKTKEEIKNILKLNMDDSIILASGKTGFGVDVILENIVQKIKPPQGDINAPLQALIFDSIFDTYKGVIPYIRIVNGIIRKGDKIRFIASKAVYEVIEVGIFSPKPIKKDFLSSGDVGYLSAFIKNIDAVKVGDTITLNKYNNVLPLPGYRQVNPVVFCGLYPTDSIKFSSLEEALQKLKLNDSSLIYERESSTFLGVGFRVGFLGLLHMDITKERIIREFGLEVVITAPSVVFHVSTLKQKIIVDNLSKWPKNQSIEKIEEPYIQAFIKCPEEYIGSVIEISQDKRGQLQDIQYFENKQVILKYLLPFSEVIYNYFDQLKSVTKGYAFFDYQMDKYYASKLKKVDILLNSEIIDALSFIAHEEHAYRKSKNICQKLKELIPKQMFEIVIQAAIGKKIITRETIKALRKNVIDKCYGGDISRKKKLLAKQKKGKKKMKNLGKAVLPQKAFLAILSSYKS
jgi:GTP-binding protein LepA